MFFFRNRHPVEQFLTPRVRFPVRKSAIDLRDNPLFLPILRQDAHHLGMTLRVKGICFGVGGSHRHGVSLPSSRLGMVPSALGIGAPWGQVVGLPIKAANRSSNSSEITCSSRSAS